MKLSAVMLAGAFFMLVIVGFSTFIGGISSQYSDSSLNNSELQSQYSKMTSLYEKSNTIQQTLLKNDSTEGDPSKDYNVLDALGRIKDAILLFPKVLIDSAGLLFGKEGIIYSFAQDIGVSETMLNIIILIASISILFTITTKIGGFARR